MPWGYMSKEQIKAAKREKVPVIKAGKRDLRKIGRIQRRA